MKRSHIRTFSIEYCRMNAIAATLSRVGCPRHEQHPTLVRSAMVGSAHGRRGWILQIAGCCDEMLREVEGVLIRESLEYDPQAQAASD